MNRGEIWFYEFKKPDKARPVLILTRQEMIPYLNSVTIVPITRTIRGVASEVLLSIKDGVKEACAANLFHLMTVPKTQFKKFICTLNLDKLEELKEAMLFAMGFDE